MIYGTENYAEAERAAWQAGNYQLAEALNAAIELQESLTENERLQSIVDGIQERITEANWRTGKKAELKELVETIINELAEGR